MTTSQNGAADAAAAASKAIEQDHTLLMYSPQIT